MRTDRPPFTLEQLARGDNGLLHEPQLRFTSSLALRILLMCSRRAGKTHGIAQRFAKRAVDNPGSNRVYIALTKDQTRNVTMWEPIWKPMCERWGLCKPKDHDETRMITYFANGATVRFTGSDDVRKIPTELGGELDEAVVDESQDQADRVLVPLVEKILPPALGRHGVLMMSGVVPEVPAGFYYRTWQAKGWENHNFSMFDNPHYEDPQGVVDAYLAAHPGLSVDSPLIQRDYYGRFVFDPSATAYTYSRDLNAYEPEPPDWLEEAYRSGLSFCHPLRDGADGEPRYGLMAAKPLGNMFSFAIDPGANVDRVSIEGICWGGSLPHGHIQHVFEWTSPRGAKLSTHQFYAVAALAQKHYLRFTHGGGFIHWRYDAGSSQNTIDNLRRDYGIAVMLAAKKADLRGQVDRVNDVLTRARCQIMAGSAVEEDFETARWDKDALARGQLRWSSNWHPDPSEAFRYATQDFFEGRQEAERPVYATEIEAAAAQAKAAREKRFADADRRAALPQTFQRRKPDIWGKGWRPR